MPFAKSARVELVNESAEPHHQYFYVDYESLEEFPPDKATSTQNSAGPTPFQVGVPKSAPNTPAADRPNLGRQAWESNYLILEAQGRGHYLGCTLSVTNYTGDWWGEGDDMIWVDGYQWPPDLHGTGSEDYLGHAGGMHPSAFLRNGSSIFEALPSPFRRSSCGAATAATRPATSSTWRTRCTSHRRSRSPSSTGTPTTWRTR